MWLLFCPPLWGVVLAPPNHPTVDPYDMKYGTWASERSVTSDGEEDWHHVPDAKIRHAEVTVGAFTARDENVFSRTLGLRIFLGKLAVSGSWDRMYETPGDGSLSRLDFYRFHLSSNALGGSARSVEIYPLMGAAVMHGSESTGAFDAGLEARIYPSYPFTIYASSIASVFARGPVLFDTKVEAGVSIDRFELRAGLRWLYQHQAQGFAGPMASMVIRL